MKVTPTFDLLPPPPPPALKQVTIELTPVDASLLLDIMLLNITVPKGLVDDHVRRQRHVIAFMEELQKGLEGTGVSVTTWRLQV